MPRTRTLVLAALVVVLLLVVAGLAVALRPIEMPEPSGPHGVGRTTRLVADDRVLDLGAGPVARQLPVTVYYPAGGGAVEAVPYMPAAVGDELRADMGVFARIPGAWSLIRAHVADEAALASNGPFPVVTFSPGIGTQPELFTTLLADVASRGYVVLAITPTYSVPASVIEGEVVRATDRGMNMVPGTIEERTRASEALGEVWVEDILAVLDAAAAWNATDPLLAGALDLARVAAIGHSFGGGAAGAAAARDARIVASANMDGTPFGAPDVAGNGKPSLLIEDPILSPPASRDALNRDAYVGNASEGYRVTIEGASHEAFVTDLAIVADRYPFIGDHGERAPRDSVRFVVDHVGAFLDHALRGERSPLLQPRDENGVRVQAWNA